MYLRTFGTTDEHKLGFDDRYARRSFILIANNNYSPNMNKSSRPISPPPYLTPNKKNNTKSVTFNEITEEIYFENDTDRSMFYTAYDYQEMKEQRYITI